MMPHKIIFKIYPNNIDNTGVSYLENVVDTKAVKADGV